MTMTDTRLDLSSLEDDGDTLELEDGRVLRLKIVPDDSASINDFDGWGKVSEYAYDYGQHIPRPDGFDGNAEKIQVDRGSWMWWQPPNVEQTGAPARGTPEFRKMRDQVREILEFGFLGVILELCNGQDYYGKPIVVANASLWSIEASTTPDYLQSIVAELASELEVI